MFVAIAGLIFAFAVFYAFGWPSTIEAQGGDPITFDEKTQGELLHALFRFSVSGPKDVRVTNVQLEDQSADIDLFAVHLARGDSASLISGSPRGNRPDIEALPRALNTVLKPGDEGFFVVSFRVFAAGRSEFRGLRVKYSSGWLTRSMLFAPAVTVNVPATATPSPGPR